MPRSSPRERTVQNDFALRARVFVVRSFGRAEREARVSVWAVVVVLVRPRTVAVLERAVHGNDAGPARSTRIAA
jgi:hypothetical protein